MEATTQQLPELPQPTTFEEAERLIRQFYQPGLPHEIDQIDRTLRSLQKAPGAFAIADALLHSEDDTVRFFAALTFTIKINNSWWVIISRAMFPSLHLGIQHVQLICLILRSLSYSVFHDITRVADSVAAAYKGNRNELSDQDAADLLLRLLHWLILFASTEKSARVIRKLCSSLVAYFLHASGTWRACVKHVAYCLCVGRALPEIDIHTTHNVSDLIAALDAPKLTAVLLFATTLVEEVGKTSPTSPGTSQYHAVLRESNLNDIVETLAASFCQGSRHATNPTVVEEAIFCYQAWIKYAAQHASDSSSSQTLFLKPLQSLTATLFRLLEESALPNPAYDLVVELLEDFPSFFMAQDVEWIKAQLSSPETGRHVSGIMEGTEDESSIAYAKLLLAYGNAETMHLAKNTQDASTQLLLDRFLGILSRSDFPFEEEDIFCDAFEFWINYAEALDEIQFDSTGSQESGMELITKGGHYLEQVMEICMIRCRVPPIEVMCKWDSDAAARFWEFRRDYRELILSSFPFVGNKLFENFIDRALHFLQSNSWHDLEVALFALSALSEPMAERPEGDRDTARLFQSELFDVLTTQLAHGHPKLQQTSISLLSNYSLFFSRHREYLEPMLKFLFTALGYPSMDEAAAKSLFSTCYTLRGHLASRFRVVVEYYQTVLRSSALKPSVRVKVVGAIACIAEASVSKIAQVEALGQILEFVEADLHLLAKATISVEAHAVGLHVLKSLESIGLGMRKPDREPIDLDSESDTVLSPEVRSLFHAAQHKIMAMCKNILEMFPEDGDIIEAVCQVLRTGYTESGPGPFVFGPSFTRHIFLRINVHNPRFGHVLETATVLMRAYPHPKTPEMMDTAGLCLLHALQLVSAAEGG
jgi:hypothetical protein